MSNVALDKTKVHELNPHRPPSAPNAYKLVRWKPIYDMIVAGHIMGHSNKKLAADYDFTEVHISNILRSDQAQIMIAEATSNIRAAVKSDNDEILDIQQRIQKKALQRIEKIVDREDLADSQPFHFLDRLMQIAKPQPISSPSITSNPTVIVNNQVNQQNNTEVKIRTEELQRLNKALEISNE